MTEEKQQKFTAKVRRGLVWVHAVAGAELAKKKAEATGVRIEGFTASELADVESALTWIGQNKESQGSILPDPGRCAIRCFRYATPSKPRTSRRRNSAVANPRMKF